MNNRATSYQYDVFGRLSKAVGPLDTSSQPTVSYDYVISTASLPHRVVETRRVVSGSTEALSTYSYLDGLGRTLQRKAPMPQGKQLVSGMRTYNNRGLVERVYQDYVVDSNLDWGQDFEGLCRYVNEKGYGEIALFFYGPSNPAWYNIRYRMLEDSEFDTPEKAVYAVGAHQMDAVRWTSRYEPDAVIGNSVFIYDLTKK